MLPSLRPYLKYDFKLCTPLRTTFTIYPNKTYISGSISGDMIENLGVKCLELKFFPIIFKISNKGGRGLLR